jgi:diguanylate cyclase (GGDEF)-like protein
MSFIAALTDRSAHDQLTGLLTREFGAELLEAQFRIAERDDAPLAVLFVDLDRFKAVNDRFGHEAGDRVLRAAAAALLASFRRQEAVMRWGGEEFLVLLPNTDEAGAGKAIARLARRGLGQRPDGTAQTASIGLAERRRERAADWLGLVKAADQRMYLAKQAGRNRWLDSAGSAAEFMAGAPAAAAAPAA